MTYQPGTHFLQVPGPSNVPQRVLRAIDMPTIDHRGPEFAKMALGLFDALKRVFKTTTGEVVIYASSGSGAWEAAIENALSPGERVMMFEVGQFATLWQQMAQRLGLDVDFVAGDWRRPVDPAVVEAKLSEDRGHKIKAVMIVHNETSTSVVSDVAAVRRAIDAAHHPALFMVDTISSLASMDYRHDEWGVDVTIAGSQKGLMLPPGLSFNAISKKALAVAEKSGGRRSYFSWADQLAQNRDGFFPQTPATNLLYGLRESLKMLDEEGLDNVFARHVRHGEAARRAVRAWGLELQCADPNAHSSTVTTVQVPADHDADAFRATVLERYNMSLGAGLGKVKGKVFRIGHLGDFNDLMLMAALCGVQLGLGTHGIAHSDEGVDAALGYLGNAAKSANKPLAYA
jgi:alanine-glyoxylate transaminase / serine-glyoxylate transaminase / serine-pyruvate transaminase